MRTMITVRSLTSDDMSHIKRVIRECDTVDLAVGRAKYSVGLLEAKGHKLNFGERMAHLDLNLHLLGVK